MAAMAGIWPGPVNVSLSQKAFTALSLVANRVMSSRAVMSS